MKRAFAVVLVAGIASCAAPAPTRVAPFEAAPPPPPAIPQPSRGESLSPPPRRESKFWTDAEMALLDKGLEVLNCTRADMGFQKRPIDDPFRLAVVNKILDDPLVIGDEAQAWDEAAKTGDVAALLGKAIDVLEVRYASPDIDRTKRPRDDALFACFPPFVGMQSSFEMNPVQRVIVALTWVKGHMTDLTGPTPVVSAPLLRKMLLSQVEKPKWAIEAADLSDAEFLAAAQKARLIGPAWTATDLIGPLVGLRNMILAGPAPSDLWKGRRRFDTEAGPIVVYGYGDDIHDEAADADAALVIDLGGNDTWTRGASASVLKNRPVSVCIDLGGDDHYISKDDLCFGAALGGVAVQWDCGNGDDVYEAGHCSLGAGICGVGILVDEGGDDIYRCRDFGLGAGAFGIGILLDKAGNDYYHCDLFGEGFACTRGCGVLADLDGNDVYDAGGVHLHAPLYNDRYQSLSQGFSIGMRPDASGGVGVLVDVKGNDRYNADIYGQGASYWYSLGILVDDDGNDTYNLGQYGQGSGIHLSAGILVDRAGSDLYYLKNGVGMGGAHDYSVGMLVDRAGDDYYAGSGGSQGGALTDSVALLFDDGGNDAYAVATEGSQGYASPARGTGGIGLLLDAGGKDTYSEWDRDGAAWTKELLGAGLDEPSVPAAGGVGDPGTTSITPEKAKEAVDKDGTVPGPDGKPVDDLDRMWKLSSQWEVGDNRVIVPIARERLIALGKPALDRAVEKVGTKDGLEYRACEVVFGKFPAGEVVPRLLDRTKEAEVLVRKGSVRALAGLQAAAAVDRFVEMLDKDPDTRGTVLGALAGLKKAPPAVEGLVRSPKEGEGVQAVLCLAGVGDAGAVAFLCGALGPDVAFPVRMAAWDRLAALGEPAVASLAKVSLDDTLPTMARRNALRALGRTKSAAAVEPLSGALKSPDRLLRLSAFQAAGDLVRGLGPDPGKGIAAALAAAREVEQDPLVKRMR
jgi:HEAT repeat protein